MARFDLRRRRHVRALCASVLARAATCDATQRSEATSSASGERGPAELPGRRRLRQESLAVLAARVLVKAFCHARKRRHRDPRRRLDEPSEGAIADNEQADG
jgi:hypothetical protein